MFDVGVLLDASFKRIVDELELTDHVICTLAQADLDVRSQFRRDLTLAARPRYVFLGELHPRHRVRQPDSPAQLLVNGKTGQITTKV